MLSWLVRRACEAVGKPLNRGFFNREVGTDSPFILILPTIAVAFVHAVLTVVPLEPFYSPRLKEFSA